MRQKTPVVIFDHTVPVVVPESWGRSHAYRRWRQQLAGFNTFDDVAAFLAASLDGPGPDRFSAITWCAPADPLAQRFLNSIGSRLATGRASSARDQRLLVRLLTGHTRAKPGRKVRAWSLGDLARCAIVRAEWDRLVTAAWDPDDREPIVATLTAAAVQRFVFSVAHRRALRRLLTRARVRPSDVVYQLTAWEMGIAVRRVRSGRAVETIYA